MASSSKISARQYRNRAEILSAQILDAKNYVTRLERLHRLMLALAKAHETGTVSPVLVGVTKTQIASIFATMRERRVLSSTNQAIYRALLRLESNHRKERR